MVKTNYGVIPNDMFKNYLDFLISKFFKILPIYESEVTTLKDYLSSLMVELSGNQSLIIELKNDPNFLSLLGTIQYFIDNKCDHRTIKKETFKCIRIIENLQVKYIKEE